MFDFDWTEYERVIGEFVRTYKEGEAVGVTDNLKTLSGIATQLLQQRQMHRLIRDRLVHGGHMLMADKESLHAKGRNQPSHDDWYPCSVPTSFIAQIFLGLGYNDPVRLLHNKWDRGPAKVPPGGVTMKNMKDGIAKMRLSAVVATAASHVGKQEKKKDSKGRRRAALNLQPNIEVPILHVTREYDSERNQALWVARYDETAQELGAWRGIDEAVGAFLRAWSEILVGLRELEIMMANPCGPSSRMDLSTAATDMKRAEKVLGSGHPITRGLMDVSKERALIVHGNRMVEGIVDQSLHAEGGVYLCSVETIKDYIEPARRAVKEVVGIADERRAKWGHAQ